MRREPLAADLNETGLREVRGRPVHSSLLRRFDPTGTIFARSSSVSRNCRAIASMTRHPMTRRVATDLNRTCNLRFTPCFRTISESAARSLRCSPAA
jgi:hypothetical protein